MSDVVAPAGGDAPGAGTAFVVEVEVPGEPAHLLSLRGTVEFGRRGDGVVLADAEASRRHFRLIGTGGAVLVEDLGSTNGTRVGGVPVAGARRLVVGDVVGAGRSTVRLVEVGPVAAPPPPGAGSSSAPPPPAPSPAAAPPAPSPAAAAPAPADAAPGRRGVAVAGTPLVLQTVGEVVRLAPVEALVRAAAEAWAGLAGLGLAGAAAGAGTIDVTVDATSTGTGAAVDVVASSLGWRIPADLPPDPLLPALAVLVAGRRGPIDGAIVVGLALEASGVPDPAPGLARRSLPATSVATGALRLAMARSFVGYLLARCGREAVATFVGSAPGDPAERARALLGLDLATLDVEWRGLVADLPPAGPLRGPLLHGLTIGSAPELDPVRRLVDGAVAVLDLDAADRATADGLAARATAARVPAGGTAGEGRWLAVVTGGRGELVVDGGPFAGTVVAEVGVGDRYGFASFAGAPRGLTLRAVEDVDLLVVDEASLAAVGLVADQGGRTRPAAGPVEEVAIVDVLLADEPAG